MSSGVKILLKILVAVVSYCAAFALAIYAVKQLLDGTAESSPLAMIILIIIAICGFIATKSLPFFYATGGGTDSIPVTLFLISLRLVISFFTGVFVAPWKIAKKLMSLIPD